MSLNSTDTWESDGTNIGKHPGKHSPARLDQVHRQFVRRSVRESIRTSETSKWRQWRYVRLNESGVGSNDRRGTGIEYYVNAHVPASM
jgi:hypothetical protein